MGVSESLGGSAMAVRQWQVVNNVVKSQWLVDRVTRTGAAMAKSAERINNNKISGIRTSGSSLWIDTNDVQSLRHHLAKNGVLVKSNGTRGVMVKPSLTLEEH